MKAAKIWIVLLDSFNLRVLELAEPNGHPVEVHRSSSNAQTSREQDLVSDAPGRAYDSRGQGRHGMEPQTHHRDLEKNQFINDALEWLDKAERKSAFDRVVLVAPPKVLGKLRAGLSGNIKKRITDEVGKDLVNASTDALEKAILKMKLA